MIQRHGGVWPLLAGAFALQMIAPLVFKGQFYFLLTCDDFADLLAAGAIFSALPYHRTGLKMMALSYVMWCNFVLISNVALEVDIENIRQWQLIAAGICLCVYGFLAGMVRGICKVESCRSVA